MAEYLAGEASYPEMELRYGVAPGTLHRWVKAAGEEAKRAEEAGRTGANESVGGEDAGGGPNLATEVKRLRIELGKARLHNKLLNTMIDIAEEEFEIPIRKKRGARQ